MKHAYTGYDRNTILRFNFRLEFSHTPITTHTHTPTHTIDNNVILVEIKIFIDSTDHCFFCLYACC